jgi:hypothetical protein
MCGGGGGGSQQVQVTEDMVEQQKINAELWNHYVQNYKPLMEKYTAKVTDPARQVLEEKEVAGRVNAEIMKNVDPSKVSGNPVVNTRRLSGLSEAGTGAKVKGQGGARSRVIADTQNVIDIGRGKAATAQAGLGDIAAQSVRTEIADKTIQEQEQAAIENAYGSAAGIAAAGLLKGSPAKKKPAITSVQV